MYLHQNYRQVTSTSRVCRRRNLTLAASAIALTLVGLRPHHARAFAAPSSFHASPAASALTTVLPRSPLSFGPDLLRRLLTRPARHGRNTGRRSANLRIAQTIPIFSSATPQSVVGGSGSPSVTITVDNTGGAILIGTDHPSLLVSPSGSWPYQLNYPDGGSTSQTITLATAQVSQSTNVKIYACPSDEDISNPNNWTTNLTVTLTPQ